MLLTGPVFEHFVLVCSILAHATAANMHQHGAVTCRAMPQSQSEPIASRPKSKLEQLMEIDKMNEKHKAIRAAASVPASTARKDMPWLVEGIVVKVCLKTPI